MDKQTLGSTGEDMAVSYLVRNGYELLERNYRSGRYEIDIICRKNNWVVFIEVKTRSSLSFGYPEEHVLPAQAARIVAAAVEYLESKRLNCLVRYDVISIHLQKNASSLKHFEDAFY